MEVIVTNSKNIDQVIIPQEQKLEEDHKHKISYVIHFFLGAGNLLPWNALITGVDYFEYLYPNKHVEKLFSVVYMTSSLLVLVFMLSLNCCRRSLSLRLRMNIGYSMFAISLMATPVMNWAWLKNEKMMSSSFGYGMVIVSVLICGLADGLIGGSLIGTAGKLPKQYMQAVFAGTASSGVLISVLRIITKASVPQTTQGLRTSAQSYFIVSSLILILCIICCHLLCKLPNMQHYYNKPNDVHNYKLPVTCNNNDNNHNKQYSSLLSPPKLCQTLNKIKFPCFGILAIYTVTLSIFPGYLSENIKSDVLKDWYPIVLITTYNLFDFAGKSVTGLHVMKDVKRATWCSLMRVLFYPLFLMCLRGPQWLRNEAVVVVLTVALGLSNGYLTSVLMILTPKVVVVEDEAEVAAIVMVVMLGVGLVFGSVVGWFWII